MKSKKSLSIMAVVMAFLVMGIGSFAATNKSTTPADVLAKLLGKTSAEVQAQRDANKVSYGKIASDAGVLNQFKADVTTAKKADIEARVAAGTLSREKADAYLAKMAERQANCTGTGTGNGENGLKNGNGRADGTGIKMNKQDGTGKNADKSGVKRNKQDGTGRTQGGKGNGAKTNINCPVPATSTN